MDKVKMIQFDFLTDEKQKEMRAIHVMPEKTENVAWYEETNRLYEFDEKNRPSLVTVKKEAIY